MADMATPGLAFALWLTIGYPHRLQSYRGSRLASGNPRTFH